MEELYKNILVSVIVPVYNVEQYIEECINSLIRQTHANVEIILIDDGSTDNSKDICDFYQNEDNRIKVVHQRNAGQAAARNHGIAIAKGEYLLFVDSDDYVSEQYIKNLLEIAIVYKADVVTCYEQKFWNSKAKNIEKIKNRNISVYTASEALELLCYQKEFSQGPCGKLIKNTIMTNIRFPLNVGYEDMAVVYKMFDCANLIVRVPEYLYFYRQRANSTMHQKYTKKKLDRLIVTKEMQTFIMSKYSENENAMNARFLLSNMQVLMELPFNRKYLSIRKEVAYNLRTVRRSVIKDKKAKVYIRLMAVMSYGGIFFLMCLGRVYKKIVR